DTASLPLAAHLIAVACRNHGAHAPRAPQGPPKRQLSCAWAAQSYILVPPHGITRPALSEARLDNRQFTPSVAFRAFICELMSPTRYTPVCTKSRRPIAWL